MLGRVLTQRVYFFLYSPNRRSHRQLCQEDGEEEWWPVHPGCPSSVPGEETAKSSRSEWPREGNGVTLLPVLPPLPRRRNLCSFGGVCKVPKDWQECRETSALWSVPVPRGQTQPSLCLSQQGKLPKLSCVAAGQWQQLIYLVASAVAEALMQSVVPILWHLFDLKRSQCCYKWNFS